MEERNKLEIQGTHKDISMKRTVMAISISPLFL